MYTLRLNFSTLRVDSHVKIRWDLSVHNHAIYFSPRSLFTGKGGLKEHMRSVSKLQKSQSCMTLNGNASGTGLRSRSESVSSLCSLRSLSNPFEVLSTEDTNLDDFDSGSEYSSVLSQDVLDESSLQDQAPSMSSFYFEVDASLLDKISPQNFVTSANSKPVASGGQRDDGWMEAAARGKDSKKNPQRNFPEKEFNGENRGKLNFTSK